MENIKKELETHLETHDAFFKELEKDLAKMNKIINQMQEILDRENKKNEKEIQNLFRPSYIR